MWWDVLVGTEAQGMTVGLRMIPRDPFQTQLFYDTVNFDHYWSEAVANLIT